MHTILCSNWTETKSLNECAERTTRMKEEKKLLTKRIRQVWKHSQNTIENLNLFIFSLAACLSVVVVFRIAKIHAYCVWTERTYQHSTRARLASLIADTNTCTRTRPHTLRHQQTQPAIRLESRLVLVYTFKCKLSTLKQWTHSHENRGVCWFLLCADNCRCVLNRTTIRLLFSQWNVAPGIDIERVLCFYSWLSGLNTLQVI